MKISVIVPVYNSEKWLRGCVDSILAQTHSDIELILIDDESQDKSSEICDEYARQDKRVIVCHKKNEGVSAARNKGIELSRGDYIGFVDSDDEILPNMFEKLSESAVHDNADIVFCDSVAISTSKSEQETIDSLKESCSLLKKDITPEILLELAGAVWRGLYRKSLIKDNAIKFPIGLKISEDRIFNITAIGMSRKISYRKEIFYRRMIYPESTVHRYHPDYYEIVKAGKSATTEALDLAWGGDERFKNAYLTQFVYAAIRAIENLKHKDSGISYFKRRREIKKICCDEELISAILITDYTKINERAEWILKKRISRLCSKNLRLYKFRRRVLGYLSRKFKKG